MPTTTQLASSRSGSGRIERSFPNHERIKEATDLLKCAKKPYIIAGGGIHYSEAWNELAALAEKFGIPVGETHAGRGAIQSDSDLLLGGTGHLGTQVLDVLQKKLMLFFVSVLDSMISLQAPILPSRTQM